MSEHKNQNLFKIYSRNVLNLIIISCVITVLSILVMGIVSYNTSKAAVIDKLKTSDLRHIIKSIGAQVDGRIERAKETSVIIADDPSIQRWFLSGESNNEYQKMVEQKLKNLTTFDYTNIFMANAITKNYWNNGILVDTLSESDPDDVWYFNAMNSHNKITLNIDFNRQLNNTYLWVNTLMSDTESPLGVAGVGVSLQDLAAEFNNYNVGEGSNLWLVDAQGMISLAEDLDHRGQLLKKYVPETVCEEILQNTDRQNRDIQVTEYTNQDGKVIDLAFLPLRSSEWMLVFQIPRVEVVSILDSMRINTLITILITLSAILLLFYLVSTRIANPYKKTLQLNQELENVIAERTNELTEKNLKIMDSIDYAKRIQEAILPSAKDLSAVFKEYFVVWKPRDIVGGDFYFLKPVQNGHILVVADCTGHGVPGAFMTIAVNSILHQLTLDNTIYCPSEVIKALDKLLKQHLNKSQDASTADDGLEAGVCYINNQGEITFAGAGIDLYVKNENDSLFFKGISKGIGYRKSSLDKLTDHKINRQDNSMFYLSTDGYIDQNGGTKDYSFGRRRFNEIIEQVYKLPLAEQRLRFVNILEEYMGLEAQRDDITVIGFKV